MQRSSPATRATQVRTMVASGAARQLRTDSGLSLEAAARSLDVTGSAVLRWERGDHFPRGRNLVAYHKFLTKLTAAGEATAAA